MRARILSEVGRRPGASALELAAQSGCSYASTRYHLRRLERFGLVLRQDGTRPVRYFAASQATRDYRLGITILRGHTAARVMALIHQHPGMTKADLSRATGFGGPTIAWHIKRLKEAGLIEVGKAGRRVPIVPVVERMAAISKMLAQSSSDVASREDSSPLGA
jgi:predicted transcriptional regulator